MIYTAKNTYLVHGSKPGGGALLVVSCLHAELLRVLRARRLIVQQHACGTRQTSCVRVQRAEISPEIVFNLNSIRNNYQKKSDTD